MTKKNEPTIQDVLKAIGVLDNKIGAVDNKIGTLDKSLRGEISTLDKSLRGEIGALDNKIGTLEENMMGEFGRVYERFGVVDKRFDGVDKRLDKIEQQAVVLEQKVDQGFADTDIRLLTISREIDDINRVLSRMQKQGDDDIRALGTDVVFLRDRMKFLEKKYKQLQTA